MRWSAPGVAFADEHALVRRGGRITEVSPTHFRVRGLSDVARLGDMVEHRSHAGTAPRRDRADRARRGADRAVRARRRCRRRRRRLSTSARSRSCRMPHGAAAPSTRLPARSTAARRCRRAIRADAALIAQPPALARQRVGTAFATGVKVIDIFTPICFGQRLGIFAGSGVGKSTLLAMLAARRRLRHGRRRAGRRTRPRGARIPRRHDRPGMHGQDRRRRLDQRRERHDAPPRARHRHARRRAFSRLKGDSVLLVLDSITRFAHALREVATGTGEPPVARGYPASVFTELPKLLERAGPGVEGYGLDHRHHLRAGRRRRPQRPGRQFRARHSRRPCRARPRHRRAGPLPAGQSAVVHLAPGAEGLERRPAHAGDAS